MNTAYTTRPRLPTEADALEARFALRLTARLEAGAQTVPHDISERLRIARSQALAQARQRAVAARRPETAAAPGISIVGIDAGSGAATLGRLGGGGGMGGDSVWWNRLGWVLPALALALGLTGMGEWESRQQISRAAEIDTALLGDDLPPAAYLDAGFVEFLRKPPEASPAGAAQDGESSAALMASVGH